MKKIVAALITAVVIMSCSQKQEGFEIQGTLNGELESGVQAFLRKRSEEGRFFTLDTTIVVDGKYSFSGQQVDPEIYYIFFDVTRGNIPVIIENGTIEVTAQKDSLQYFKLKGTLQNELFQDFLDGSRTMSYRARAMNADMRKASADMDTVQMNSLRQEYTELQEEAKNFELNYIKENPNAYISALIVEKVQQQKLLPEGEIKNLFETLTPEVQNSNIGKRIKERIEKSENVTIGSRAPNFSAPTPAGEELALNDVLGKVTIVDFWAAWCRPCRAENPNVVRIYNKYKDQGLSILGVSLDRKAEDWKQAIADDGLEWNHVSNVEYFDEIAELYNVDAIPATFILDETGTIVAKNLRGPALEEKIVELLQ
ncbi:TlpA disulfide reductase family protein [Lentiprolixibacter aurantiacus]|uniref:TlpA disulfide reductase family protein n=1 Tax=Lentiprolixibacter aurantiacus TaxID=2993939 RepID=A0AAE3SNZ6_9FLAO|nr:TlpA disulfide reductase family protein [Lentiprolixibacter aurantiacus]MCX2719671.1 TlpA disulfide reductase family protein [Lentiprolixibacter aurantiacus]